MDLLKIGLTESDPYPHLASDLEVHRHAPPHPYPADGKWVGWW